MFAAALFSMLSVPFMEVHYVQHYSFSPIIVIWLMDKFLKTATTVDYNYVISNSGLYTHSP